MSDPNQESNQYRNEINEYELRKIKAEVSQLEKKCWQKASYLTVLATMIIGAFTFIISFRNGFISSELKNIELKEKLFELEKKEHEKKIADARKEFSLEINKVNNSKDSLNKLNDSLSAEISKIFTRDFSKAFSDTISKKNKD